MIPGNLFHRRQVLLFLLILLVSCGKKSDLPYRELKIPKPVRDVQYLLRPEGVTFTWKYLDSREAIFFEIWRKDEGRFIKIGELKEYSFTDKVSIDHQSVEYSIVSATQEGLKQEYRVTVTSEGFPAPPQDFKFRVLNDGVEFTWEALPDCVYNIYRVSPGFPEVILNELPLKEGYFVDTPEPSRSFYYRIRCKKGHIEGYASEIKITPDDYIPMNPSGLRFSTVNNEVVLTWRESPEKWVRSYRIYRGDGNEFSVIGESIYPLFVDSAPTEKEQFYYITALGPTRESGPSEKIKVVKMR